VSAWIEEVKVALGSFVPDRMIVSRCQMLAVRSANTMWGNEGVPVHKMTDMLNDARLFI
jgi:hypothetical protein